MVSPLCTFQLITFFKDLQTNTILNSKEKVYIQITYPTPSYKISDSHPALYRRRNVMKPALSAADVLKMAKTASMRPSNPVNAANETTSPSTPPTRTHHRAWPASTLRRASRRLFLEDCPSSSGISSRGGGRQMTTLLLLLLLRELEQEETGGG